MILAFLLLGASQATSTPTLTTALPLSTKAPELAERAITSFHTIVSTSYPQNRYSIGYGKFNGKGDFYTAACIDGPYAVSGVWAGCGDLVFTRCIGPTAFARQSTVSCMGTCLTHKIYNYDDSHVMTRFIACNFPGTYDGSMTLLRTPVRGTAEPTSDEFMTITTTASTTATTTDSGVGLLKQTPLAAVIGIFIISSWVLL